MPTNFLEQLVAEWYEYRGYFVRRNIKVGRRAAGGFESELDVVAFHPQRRHLVQIEPSMDTDSWEIREKRYTAKFAAGRRHIPDLFAGFPELPGLDQIAIFALASTKNHRTVAGGQIMSISDLMLEIRDNAEWGVRHRRVDKVAVPEQFTILRSMQFAAHFWPQAA